MVRFVMILSIFVFAACGTTVKHHRITLSDIDPELGARFESEGRINALHPANLTRDGDVANIVWVDFCHHKECGETAMAYNKLLLAVGTTAATVEQLSFVARQLDAGAVTASEVEAFLELGWDRLPEIARSVERQRRTLVRLDPDRDFDRDGLRAQAWSAIQNAAEQLARAERKLEGLDDVIGAAYRELEPAFACTEPEVVDGVILSLSPETKRRLEELTERANGRSGAAFAGDEQGALQHVVRRGLESLERDAVTEERLNSGSAPVSVTRLHIDGPLDPSALRAWFDVRSDAIASCLPSTARRAREFEVLVVYSSESVLADVHDATRAGGDDVTADCVVKAVEAAVGDQDAERPGTVRVGVVVRPRSHVGGEGPGRP